MRWSIPCWTSASAMRPSSSAFFRLKARWLGMERLRRYDIYAPVAPIRQTLSLRPGGRDGVRFVPPVRPAFAELAERVFAAKPPRQRSAQGQARRRLLRQHAAPDLTPWVLVNYQGRPDDVATLAHELGHAIHSMLASEHILFTQHASLPLAETASTFGEMMLVDRLLAERERPSASAATCFSARSMTRMPPSCARLFLPCSNARRTR